MKNQTENTPVPLTEMTLRDFFAVQAMQAIIAKNKPRKIDLENYDFQLCVAGGAYSYADAMMEVRK